MTFIVVLDTQRGVTKCILLRILAVENLNSFRLWPKNRQRNAFKAGIIGA